MGLQADYVIIGAGSAGCVLANRLSADARNRVILVEAGGSDRRFWIRTPLGYARTFADTRVNWCYTTAADPGLNGREAFWPRGRVLGGSSSINAMAYMRGLPSDFDDWVAAGADGWDWAEVQATYRGLEQRHETGPGGGSRRYGSGPVMVSDLRRRMHPFTRHFLSAAEDMGWPVLDHSNGPNSEGLALMRSTIRGNRRWSAADAFLHPARKRPNLTILDRALVDRIELSEGRATGVILRRHGQVHTIRAKREVIVSAGAINAPQLLMLSGLGPAAHLRDHGIAVVKDLPQVGQGMQDHLAVSHYFRATEATLNARLARVLAQMITGAQYLLMGTGPLSAPVNQCSGYVRSRRSNRVPDLQIYANPISYQTRTASPAVEQEAGFLLCAQPCRPESRGSITLASSDPTTPPVIQANSLATENDRAMAIEAEHVLAQLAATPSVQAITAKRLEPDVTAMSDDDMLANFRDNANTVFHPSCTCRMGRNAQESVLDSRLRVHGVDGLRVVDASAFPNVTSGNTNAPVMMLAERASRMILEDAAQARRV